MLPSLTIIKKCSNCSGLIEEDTIASGNTFGAIFWTDGKREAPMLADQPWLVTCPHCQALVWIDELEYAGEVEPFSDGEAYKDAQSYNEPELQDYLTEFKNGNHEREKALYFHLRAWWAGNDKRRKANNIKHDISDEENLIQALYKILDPSDDNDRIMMAEIKREQGLFEEAEAILKEPFANELSQAVSIIIELVQKQERFVAEMNFEN